ncbi:MAG: glucokinase [Candidatus Acidiferrales bacterium]
MILAGDIGGTKSLLALFSRDGGPRAPQAERSLSSRDYPTLAEVLKDYLRGTREKVEVACLGIPGPVVEGRSETPNIPWVVDAVELERATGSRVLLLNDLEASGYGVAALRPEEFETLSEGQPNPRGNGAIIAPGTGLGEAILFWNGEMHIPSASEGGHADFAPRNHLEMELLDYLLKEFDRASFDRVVTGGGLRRVYSFFRERSREPEPGWLADELKRAEDPSAVISRVALEKRDPVCEKALDLWAALLGAEAGNLALKALATAGVYISGGIAPKILPKLRDGTFLTHFHNKGRLSSVVGRMPVRIILEPRVGLFGAARFALIPSGSTTR